VVNTAEGDRGVGAERISTVEARSDRSNATTMAVAGAAADGAAIAAVAVAIVGVLMLSSMGF
jgi:hypothetical protein